MGGQINHATTHQLLIFREGVKCEVGVWCWQEASPNPLIFSDDNQGRART